MTAVDRSVRRRDLLLLGVLAGALAVRSAAAAVPGAARASCDARVLVQLVHGVGSPPDQAWLEALSGAAGVQLQYLRALTPQLHVLRLRDAGDSVDCGRALDRLRHDPRVRSAELDKRRKHESA
jgi:hypothetical protein